MFNSEHRACSKCDASTQNKLCIRTNAAHLHCRVICLLCPLHSISANALRLRLFSFAVSPGIGVRTAIAVSVILSHIIPLYKKISHKMYDILVEIRGFVGCDLDASVIASASARRGSCCKATPRCNRGNPLSHIKKYRTKCTIFLVEIRGFEPLAFALRTRRSTN